MLVQMDPYACKSIALGTSARTRSSRLIRYGRAAALISLQGSAVAAHCGADNCGTSYPPAIRTLWTQLQ